MTGNLPHSFRVRVDATRCESNALCVAIAPELFALGDDDTAVVLVDLLTDQQREFAIHAVRNCPTHALRLDEVTRYGGPGQGGDRSSP